MSEIHPPDVSGDSLSMPEDGDDALDFHTLEDEKASHSARVYEQIREIGRGGMARVMLVEDATIEREVAMKVALPECQKEPALLRRFLIEAQITGRLDHPCIPPVHDAGVAPDGLHYFTMKWVRGKTLLSVLDDLREGRSETAAEFTRARLLGIFLKVCEGVAFAHAHGIIHRDLKPENVMIGRFGQVFVMDWGLAKALGKEGAEAEAPAGDGELPQDPLLSTDGTILGTPAYMSPEQASGRVESLDHLTDIYSLGAILYEMLTLHPPVVGETTAAVISRVIGGKIEPPRRLSPERRIPPDLESVCLRAVARDRAERYPSVTALTDDVQAFLEHRPVSAHRYGPLERVSRFVQRRPVLTLGGSAGAVVLLVAAGLVTFFILKARLSRMEAREARRGKEAAEARADTEAAKAEAAAEKAETAETKAKQAVSLLEKSRRVAEVLRGADQELGDVLYELRRSYYSAMSDEQKIKEGESLWPLVEAFCRKAPEDSASRAAVLAVKGWLRRLAGREEEALEVFASSRKVDPDVAHGHLFEAMAWLSDYIRRMRMPSIYTTGRELALTAIPKETEEMTRAREKLKSVLASIGKEMVWGETAATEFAGVLKGLRAVQAKDFTAAEEGLTRALSLPEMSWMEGELLHARAKVRFLKREFRSAIRDVEIVLDRCPDFVEAHFTRAVLWFAEGYSRRLEGDDPRGAFEKSIEAFSAVLLRSPDDGRAFNARGMTRLIFGGEQRRRREDPTDAYRQALSDFTEAVKRNADDPVARGNRARAYLMMGNDLAAQRKDPRKMFESAVADAAHVLEKFPDNALARRHHQEGCVRLASAVERRGGDPVPWLRKAAADADFVLTKVKDQASPFADRGAILRRLGAALLRKGEDAREAFQDAIRDFDDYLLRRPGKLQYRFERALAWLGLGDAEAAQKEDPRRVYARAVECFGEVLERQKKNRTALGNRGQALEKLGDAQQTFGEDPLETFKKALADFTELARLSPRDAHAHLLRGGVLAKIGRALVFAKKDDPGNFEAALAAYDEAVRRSPGYWAAHRDKGLLLEELGRVDEALEALGLAARWTRGKNPQIMEHIERVKAKAEKK
jgi:serine/threonine protein kinase/tetratricopeptide (TPR) repeat protein